MNRWWRRLAGVLAALAGMPALMACPKYGEPQVEIQHFGYQPPGPIHAGDTLTFSAAISAPGQFELTAHADRFGVAAGLVVPLHDDGVAQDSQAGDGIYTGAGVWLAEYGTGRMDTSVSTHGKVRGRPANDYQDGPPLEVKP